MQWLFNSPQSILAFLIPLKLGLHHAWKDSSTYQLWNHSACLKGLKKIYHNIKQRSDVSLRPELCSSLSINCQKLKLKEDGLYDVEPSPCFFRHRVFVKVHRQSSKMDDKYHQQQQNFYEMVEEYRANPSHQRAYMLANYMVWDFELFPRGRTEGDEQSLHALTDWRLSGYATKRRQSWRPWLILISI